MKKFFKRIVFTIMAILIMLASLRFLIDTGKYALYSWDISSIESNAAKGYWTADGKARWTEADIKQYKKAVARKEEFIENSDVAKFHNYSAYSVTGKIVRIAAILGAIELLYNSVDVLFVAYKCLIRNILATSKKVVRMRRAYNRKKSRI